MGRLDGKVALVTGASRGQGATEARLMAAEGAIVFLSDVSAEEGEAVAASCGGTFLHHDVTDVDRWEEIVAQIVKGFGALDILVNNAGVFHAGGLDSTSPADYRRVVEINQVGVFLGMQAVSPVMKDQRRGSIINISSVAGLRGTPKSIAYGASKWAVRGMTKSAALELAPYGVRVNSVHPGLVATPMLDAIPWIDMQQPESTLGRIPLGRLAASSDVGQSVLFLASDESIYITGTEMVVDGGMTA